MRADTKLVALLLMGLTGCVAPPQARNIAPNQAVVMSPNEAVIFGRVLRAHNGETKTDEERSLYLIPFKDVPSGFWARQMSIPSDKVKYNVTAGKDSYFYSVIKKDSYLFESVVFGNLWSSFSAARYNCVLFGFHMPEHADAYYIGTIFFDLEAATFPLFSYRGTVRVKDEFEEASKAFKQRNPEFTGKIVKSLVIADSSVPTFLSGWKKSTCWEVNTVAHKYEVIYE